MDVTRTATAAATTTSLSSSNPSISTRNDAMLVEIMNAINTVQLYDLVANKNGKLEPFLYFTKFCALFHLYDGVYMEALWSAIRSQQFILSSTNLSLMGYGNVNGMNAKQVRSFLMSFVKKKSLFIQLNVRSLANSSEASFSLPLTKWCELMLVHGNTTAKFYCRLIDFMTIVYSLYLRYLNYYIVVQMKSMDDKLSNLNMILKFSSAIASDTDGDENDNDDDDDDAECFCYDIGLSYLYNFLTVLFFKISMFFNITINWLHSIIFANKETL